MERRSAFTLIEVLVSIALISLVLLGLYRSLEIQRDSNKRLQSYLRTALQKDRIATALYRDLLYSDGNLSLHKGEFDRLCIQNSGHSLYGLPFAKVCWLVLKEGRELLRVEGGDYHLPLRDNERVAIDRLTGPMELFDVYRKKGDVLVVMKARGQEAQSFLLQGLVQPKTPKKTKKRKSKKAKKTKETPPGTTKQPLENTPLERNPDAHG